MLRNCLFGTYRAPATKKSLLSVTSAYPATIRIDNIRPTGLVVNRHIVSWLSVIREQRQESSSSGPKRRLKLGDFHSAWSNPQQAPEAHLGRWFFRAQHGISKHFTHYW